MNINQVKSFRAIFILNEMVNNNRIFRTIMNGDDSILEPLFIELMSNGYLDIVGTQYVPTLQGKKSLEVFMQRYREYLRVYDIYLKVDVNKNDIADWNTTRLSGSQVGNVPAEFAFAKYFDFASDEDWNDYKSEERFFDLRIPVAIFKKMDPHEIVFMSFINENRFDSTRVGWQFDVMTDAIFTEIDDICRESITSTDLGGSEVVENLIKQGTKIMFDILKQEEAINTQRRAEEELYQAELAASQADEEVIVETTTVIEESYPDDDYIVYYDGYWDPWYCSPIWYTPLFIW